MILLRLALSTALVAVPAMSQENAHLTLSAPLHTGQQASCPVTVQPEHPFTPSASYKLGSHAFWYGSEKLWTYRTAGSIWLSEPRRPGHEHEVQPLTAKLFWMSLNYDPRNEPHPSLRVTGRRLDGPSPGILTSPTQPAFTDPAAPAMVTGVYVPTPGCWEISGDYKGAKLSFVVWVEAGKGPGK